MLPENIRREYIIDWCTPGHARDLVVAALKMPGNAVQEAIWKHILEGQIEVVASRISKFSSDGAPTGRQGPLSIDPQKWVLLDADASHFWAGEAVLALPSASRTQPVRHHLHALRVDPAQVAKCFPAIALAPPVPSIPAANLDKPQAAWWNEPLVIELAARLHNQELRLTTLASLEKAARSWLASQNEYPPRKAIKQVVTPLWQRFSRRPSPG